MQARGSVLFQPYIGSVAATAELVAEIYVAARNTNCGFAAH